MSWDKNTINASKTHELMRLIPGVVILERKILTGYGLNDDGDAGEYELLAIKLPNGEIHQDVFIRAHDCDADDIIETHIVEKVWPWENWADCDGFDCKHREDK